MAMTDPARVSPVNIPDRTPAETASADQTVFPDKSGVAELIAATSRLLAGNYMRNLAMTGVTPAQTYVLRELMLRQPQTQSEIARSIQVTRASVGETLARLEKQGLVERRRSPTDGRTLLSFLTPEGEALQPVLVANTHRQNHLVSSLLSPDQEAMLQSLLTTLFDGIKAGVGADLDGTMFE